MPPPLRTAVIGSYPQPAWLVNHALLAEKVVPRIRAREIWRVALHGFERFTTAGDGLYVDVR